MWCSLQCHHFQSDPFNLAATIQLRVCQAFLHESRGRYVDTDTELLSTAYEHTEMAPALLHHLSWFWSKRMTSTSTSKCVAPLFGIRGGASSQYALMKFIVLVRKYEIKVREWMCSMS